MPSLMLLQVVLSDIIDHTIYHDKLLYYRYNDFILMCYR